MILKKEKLKSYFLCIAFLAICSTTLAQYKSGLSNGYIVKDGRRVKGEIQNPAQKSLQSSCKFRPDGSDNFIEYKPEDIDSIFVEHEGHFVSYTKVKLGEREPESYFLHVLVKGAASLLDVVDARNRLGYFLEKNGALTELKNTTFNDRSESGALVKGYRNEYKSVLTAAFANCPQNLKNTGLFTKDLVKVFTTYNQCVDPSFSTKEVKEKPVVYLGYLGGIASDLLATAPRFDIVVTPGVTTDYRADVSGLRQSKSYSSVIHGLFADFGISRKNKHTFFSTGLFVTDRLFETSAYRVEYREIDLPLSFKYVMFLRSPIRPFLAAGLLVPFVTGNKSFIKPVPLYAFTPNDNIPDGQYVHAQPSDLTFNRLRPTFAAGLDLFAFPRIKATVQFRLDHTNISREDHFDMTMTSKQVTLALAYRL